MPQGDIQKTVGVNFGLTTAAPATNDAAGFGALTFTYAEACLLTNYSGETKTWDTEEDDSFCPDPSAAQKTKPRLGEITLTLNYDKTNTAFYTILDAAQADQNQVVSVDLVHQNGTDHRYYTAQVKEANEKYGDSTARITVDIVLIPQTDTVKVNA